MTGRGFGGIAPIRGHSSPSLASALDIRPKDCKNTVAFQNRRNLQILKTEEIRMILERKRYLDRLAKRP